jgi:flagellar basal body-associated protein FliL
VLGAVLIVIVLLVVLPVAFLIGGGVVAAIFGAALDADGRRRFEGSERLEMN